MNKIYRDIIKYYGDGKPPLGGVGPIIRGIFKIENEVKDFDYISRNLLFGSIPGASFFLKHKLIAIDPHLSGYVLTPKGENFLSDVKFAEKFRETPRHIPSERKISATENKTRSKYSLKQLFESSLKEQRFVTRGNNIGFDSYWGPPDDGPYIDESPAYESFYSDLDDTMNGLIQDIEEVTGIKDFWKKLHQIEPVPDEEKEQFEKFDDYDRIETLLVKHKGWDPDWLRSGGNLFPDSPLSMIWNYSPKEMYNIFDDLATEHAKNHYEHY